jgi:hypothetical protein
MSNKPVGHFQWIKLKAKGVRLVGKLSEHIWIFTSAAAIPRESSALKSLVLVRSIVAAPDTSGEFCIVHLALRERCKEVTERVRFLPLHVYKRWQM